MFNIYIKKIIENLNISTIISEYIDISKKGNNYSAICPFHDDTNPSLSISDQKNIFKCFVCGVGGNVIDFVSEYEKISLNFAIKKLAEKAGIKIDNNLIDKPIYNEIEKKIVDALNEAKTFFQYNLNIEQGNEARQYLNSRNILNSDIEKYGIGYAPNEGLIKFLIAKGHDKSTLINASLINKYDKDFFKDRIMFAIHNKYGDVIGFSGRTIKNEDSKYINSSESIMFKKSMIFYNINNSIEHIKKTNEVYINEGFLDVIALDKIGTTNCLAIMGTSLTNNHIPFLKGKKVNLMFDFDDAGINASLKSINLLLKYNINIKIIYNEIEKDADEILREHGKEKLKEVINNKKNVFDFIYSIFKKQINPKDPDSIKSFLQKFGEYLKFGDELEKNFYIKKASKEFDAPYELIEEFIPFYRRTIFKKINNDKNETIVKTKNYSYILIKSLLKKPYLLKYFKYEKIHFFDSIAIKIGNYLSHIKKDQLNDKKFQNIWNQINEQASEFIKQVDDNDIIDTKEEFEDLVENINLESKKQTLRILRKKMILAKTNNEKKAYLISIQKFQRKKSR